MKANFYGYYADNADDARMAAMGGIDFQEQRQIEQTISPCTHVDTVNGLDIWHNHITDTYYFTDEQE